MGVGFHCKEGVVIASDEQITVPGLFKSYQMKIGNIFYGGATIYWTYAGIPNLEIVMRDGLFSKLPQFPPTYTEDAVLDAISEQIDEMKSEYPKEMEETQEFIYGVSCGGHVKFVRVSRGIIDKPQWACIGCGDSSLINYIFQSLTFTPAMLMTMDEAVSLSILMVSLAKDFVDGVGGPIDVVLLRNRDHIHFVPRQYVDEAEAKFKQMRFIYRDLHNILTNAAISKDDVERLTVNLINSIKAFRSTTRL
jgi:20S proteasome alpha/beta subunit